MTGPSSKRSVTTIVEDDVDLPSTVRGTVEVYGLSAVECVTGQAAHDHLNCHADDVLVLSTDIGLRGSISGMPLASTTAERRPRIRICVTSRQSTTRPEVLPVKVGFISKPWRAAEVLAFLESA